MIGHLVGFSQAVIFDRHTGAFYDGLVEKDRDDILSLFFKYITAEVMVNEITRAFNDPSEEIKASLKSLLPEDKYWDKAFLNK